MKKLLFFFALIATTVLIVNPPPADANACILAYKDELAGDATESVFSVSQTCKVCLVEIKAATERYLFTEDGCQQGYCVSGIGTQEARAWENNPRYDISNVSWHQSCNPTAVTIKEVRTSSNWKHIVLFINLVLLLMLIDGHTRKKN